MANDSTNSGVTSSAEDTTPHSENFFTDMQGEDAFFGPEQLAQAQPTEKVAVPQGQNVIRVQVNPGEIIELSSPFDPGATLLAREGDGNLAIRVGDVTVILQGYVDANQQAPVVIQTSDGQPIDIAVLLASTDPTIDIQTAAGPGETGPQGQGADNTGGILAQLQGGNGLGGLNAVGAQDGTNLKYGLIDGSINLDREDDLLLTGVTPFPGVQEPFLRDPFKTDDGSWTSFEDFLNEYTSYINDHKDDTDKQGNAAPGGWADFTGTQANSDDADAFLDLTTYTVTVPHSSETPERLEFWDGSQFFPGAIPSSNGEQLEARYLQNGNDPSTILLVRPSDGAIVMVFHIIETEPSTGDFHVQVVLVNRLDHPDQGQDVLSVEFSTRIPIEYPEYEEQEQVDTQTPEGPYEPEYPEYKDGPDSSVDIQDDIPEANGASYASFLHADSYKDALSCLAAFTGGKISINDYVITTDGGHADEDYIFGGNHDKDNADGPDSDPARGDEFGDKFVVGILDINFGADGPSGKIPDPSKPGMGDLLFGPKEPALTVDLCEGDTFPGVTSGGHELKVLSKETIIGGLEVLQVGYCDYDSNAKGKGGNDVVVFTLVLQANPNLPLFGAFAVEICGPIDHPAGTTAETTLPINIPILATDDDGDHPLDDVTITILVNDDAPMIKDVEYISQKGGIPCEGEVNVLTLSGGDGNSGTFTSDQYGSVDEDWLNGGGGNSGLDGGGGNSGLYGGSGNSGAGTVGNHDEDGNGYNNAGKDGDEYGKTFVKGEINVKFGGDGPADDNPFSLQVFDTSDPDNLPAFKDADGNGFTSGGHELIVLYSSEGLLEVGYTVNLGSESEPEWTDITIFTLTLNDQGCFDFCLEGPIDHTGQNEQTLPIKFDVAVTDNDGDAETVTLEIRVNDDKPEVGISYANNLEVDLQSENGFLSGGGGNSGYRETYDYGRVDEDWLQGAVGNGYAYIGNQDRDGFGVSNGNENGDSEGRTRVIGQVNVNYGGDGKSATDSGIGLHNYVVGEVFKDGDGTGNSFTSGGQTLVVLQAGSDQFGNQWVVVGIDRPDVIDVDVEATETSAVGDQTIFTFGFNTNSGNFEFELYGPMDHHETGDGVETDQTINFDLGTITDGDGDTADAIVKINVNDDKPEMAICYISGLEAEVGYEVLGLTSGGGNDTFHSDSYGRVDEDWLSGASGNSVTYYGNQDKAGDGSDNSNQDGDERGKTKVSGEIDYSYGGDGAAAGESGLALFAYTVGDVFKDGDGTTGNSFTSGGETLVVLSVGPGYVEVGIKGEEAEPTATTSVLLDGDKTIFTFEFNESTGQFEFNLYGPIDHHETGDGVETDQTINFDLGTITDGDGDTADAVVQIKVNDDRPEVGISYHNQSLGEDVRVLVGGSDTIGKIDEDWLRGGNQDRTADTKLPFAIGGFESQSATAPYQTFESGQTFSGWTVGGAGVNVINGYWPANEGSNSVDMNDDGPGSLSTVLTGLVAGKEYTVSFDLSGNPEIEQGVKELQVDVGSGPATYSVDTTGWATDFSDMVWATFTFTFTATSDTQTLTFTSLATGPCGPVLDNVKLSLLGDSNAGEHGDDTGGNSVFGQIEMLFGGDGPGDSSLGLGTYADPDPDVDGDYPAFVNGNDKDGNPLPTPTSGGHDLVVLESTTGKLVVGYFIELPTDTTVTLEVGPKPVMVTVFELTLDTTTGKFEYQQYQPLDHPTAGTEDDIQLAFTAGWIEDNDGDHQDAVIRIDVDDDVPEVGVEYFNNDGYSSTTVGLVDEDHVLSGAGNKDADGAGTGGDTAGKGAVFCNITLGGVGADGPGGSQPIGFTAEEKDTFTAKDDNGNSFTLTTADGHVVLAHVEDNGFGGYTLIGYFNVNVSDNEDKGYVFGSSTQVFTLAYDSTQTPGFGQFNLKQALAHPTSGTEDNLFLSFGIKTGATDGDGDPAIAHINIQVNDDGPQALNDRGDKGDDGNYAGNVMENDKKGADDAKVTGAFSATGGAVAADTNGDITIQGSLGLLVVHANGDWTYTPDADKTGGDDVFDYTLTDSDGDTATASLTISVEPTAIPLRVADPSTIHTDFDLTLSVTKDTDATKNKDYDDGDDVKLTDTSTGFFGLGAGHTLKTGSGDDLIFGNAGGDDIYGRAGHDAQSGGDGNDVFHNVDAEDLDGTHTLDGIHSIDGGDGYDTVELGGLATFDSDQAQAIANVEALDFTGGSGTKVSLSYDAAYGITQVGGLHTLKIDGDAGSDTVDLTTSSGKSWTFDGTFLGYNVYHAGSGAAFSGGDTVTVSVEQGVAVTTS
jgi:choice-of-anchor C domain-containing protein